MTRIFVTELLENEGCRGWGGRVRRSGLARRSGFPYATKTSDLEDACKRIQRFCGKSEIRA